MTAPNPADVELAARTLFETEWRPPHEPGWDDLSPEDRESYRAAQRPVLAALAAAGRLLPPDTDTRTEYGARIIWDDGTITEPEIPVSRETAQRRVDRHAQAHDYFDEWRATAELVSRVAAVGPWLPVPTTDNKAHEES